MQTYWWRLKRSERLSLRVEPIIRLKILPTADISPLASLACLSSVFLAFKARCVAEDLDQLRVDLGSLLLVLQAPVFFSVSRLILSPCNRIVLPRPR